METTASFSLVATLLTLAAGLGSVASPCLGADDPKGAVADEPFPNGRRIKVGVYRGTGTADDPYLIQTSEQMNALGSDPNDRGRHFKLMADLDLGGYAGSSFNLIGSVARPFRGVFDGNGHTISNFTYVVTGDEEPIGDAFVSGFGLFRCVDDPNAAIRNLTLVNPHLRPAATCPKRLFEVGALVGSLRSGSVSHCCIEGGRVQGERSVGGLVGSNSGTITDCHATCTVQPADPRTLVPFVEQLDRRESFGGLVGSHYGEILNCHATGQVTGEKSIGGLVGEAYGMISSSWAAGAVSGDSSVGGLVGKSRRSARISHCHAKGHVSGQKIIGGLVGSCSKECRILHCDATGSISAQQEAGGLVGWHEGIICWCRATALVRADANSTGGLVGLNGGTIFASCAGGSVVGRDYIGGLVGFNWRSDILQYDPVVTDSYARGRVYGEDFVGGLVGGNQGGTVLRCYSTGEVTGLAADSMTGGLIGAASATSEGEIEGCFWDVISSGSNTSAGGTGKTTAEMQRWWTYVGAGWDFAGEVANGTDDIWKMCCGKPVYPRLAWESMLVGDFVDPEGVDLADLAFLAEHWLQAVLFPCDGPDLTFDAWVDMSDFRLLAPWWRHGAPRIIYETTLDSDPGWVAEGQWQFGVPGGGGGATHGHPDPVGGCTGANVYGVNLSGDYSVIVDGPHFLTAGPFDCSEYRQVRLQFARWLNTDESEFVAATVEVSDGGASWTTVWEHRHATAMLTEEAWQTVVYDLTAVAAAGKAVFVRWGYEVKDAQAWPMSGWNIDDIVLSGYDN